MQSTLTSIFTTKELADLLGFNQAYVLRVAKDILEEGTDYRSTGKRSYIFSYNAYVKLHAKLISEDILTNNEELCNTNKLSIPDDLPTGHEMSYRRGFGDAISQDRRKNHLLQ